MRYGHATVLCLYRMAPEREEAEQKHFRLNTIGSGANVCSRDDYNSMQETEAAAVYVARSKGTRCASCKDYFLYSGYLRTSHITALP